MDVLASTRTLNDACEVKRRLIQESAPLRFVMGVSPDMYVIGGRDAPVDSSIKVYANRPITNPTFQGKLTHDRSRQSLHVPELGILTVPGQTSGRLLASEDLARLSDLRAHPANITNICGRPTIAAQFEALPPTRALMHAEHLPQYPMSTRADQRQHWSCCQSTFVRELKAAAPP
jgi:hypothetical protein